MDLSVPKGYERLVNVFFRAVNQTARGKGLQRHGDGNNFEKQQICMIPKIQGSIDFNTGQAIKKCFEVNKLDGNNEKIEELLGALNYIAAAIICLEDWQTLWEKYKDCSKRAELNSCGSVVMVDNVKDVTMNKLGKEILDSGRK